MCFFDEKCVRFVFFFKSVFDRSRLLLDELECSHYKGGIERSKERDIQQVYMALHEQEEGKVGFKKNPRHILYFLFLL